ncbi:hypothetical protein L1987_59670 [Smallanthus sonchifolius]|uniref:Uncharacterized protein n=1 Tax=Smallanthus sonchifolius TaxID=185202 RepID=A0ACB9D655_9ASTR|nr:hypothetical protein L1987_59670 [Smallanthus sonchifolius]
MLGDVFCERPKHWFLCSSLSYSSVAHRRHASDCSFPIKLVLPATDCVDRRCIANGLNLCDSGVSASLWHDHNPSPVGEGSWNVAWDMRPARWLHRRLIFGICAYLAPPPVDFTDAVKEMAFSGELVIAFSSGDQVCSGANGCCASLNGMIQNYKVVVDVLRN